MKISFIVPLYNGAATIKKSLDSILGQKTAHTLEVIVIDDGSTDNSARIAAELCRQDERVRLFSQKNRGEAAALNSGLAHCQGDFIALVESDVELDERWLDKVIAGFDSPEVMGVGGNLLACVHDPWISRVAGYEIELKFAGKTRDTKHITSANAIYRKQAFNIAGLFDENLLNASLDADFNRRIINKGYKLAYLKDASAIHHFKPALLGFLKRQYAYARYRAFLKTTQLYPMDKWILSGILLTAGSLFSLAFKQINIFICLFTLLLALEGIITLALFRIKKDPAVFLYPGVSILRNITALAGLCLGLAGRLTAPRKNKI